MFNLFKLNLSRHPKLFKYFPPPQIHAFLYTRSICVRGYIGLVNKHSPSEFHSYGTVQRLQIRNLKASQC